jgi:hypothetical protein
MGGREEDKDLGEDLLEGHQAEAEDHQEVEGCQQGYRCQCHKLLNWEGTMETN